MSDDDIMAPRRGGRESGSGGAGDGSNSGSGRLQRPCMSSRKSSGTMIVPGDVSPVVFEEEMQEGDMRNMSPRRNSQELDQLTEHAREDLVRQAHTLQTSLQQIVDRVEKVKDEHERLEDGNKFLQS